MRMESHVVVSYFNDHYQIHKNSSNVLNRTIIHVHIVLCMDFIRVSTAWKVTACMVHISPAL